MKYQLHSTFEFSDGTFQIASCEESLSNVVGAVPRVVQFVDAVKAADDVAADLRAFVEVFLADVRFGVEIELGQHRRRGSLLDVAVLRGSERGFLRQGGNGVFEQRFDVPVGFERRIAGAQTVVHRMVNRHPSEIVETFHVEVGRDGVQLVDVVGLDGVAEPDGVVIDAFQIGFGLQSPRNAARRAVVGVHDETVVGRPGVVVQAVVLSAVVPVRAAFGTGHFVGRQFLEVPAVGADVPLPMGEGAAQHGIGALGRGEERVGGHLRIELLVEIAGRRGECGRSGQYGCYMFEFHIHL